MLLVTPCQKLQGFREVREPSVGEVILDFKPGFSWHFTSSFSVTTVHNAGNSLLQLAAGHVMGCRLGSPGFPQSGGL